MDVRPIGIFDSGVGGLSVVKELIKIMPNESVVYFGDTGRVPYGTKSDETIKKYARQDEEFLLSKDVKMIIVACGTVSSVALPPSQEFDLSIMGVVAPAARDAVSATKNKKIGVIATSATVNSNSFVNQIKSIEKDAQVYQVACPLFVSLVEQGWIADDDEIAYLTAKKYLEPLKQIGVDTLILGCTHFPLLTGVIKRVMGEGVTLINSGASAAKFAKELLQKEDMLSDGEKPPVREFFVSDTPDSFESVAHRFLNADLKGQVKQINIENYGR